MLLRIAIVSAAFAAFAVAQSAATKPMKDEKGLCQAAAPADAVVILGHMAQSATKGNYSLIVEHESDKYDGPLSAATLQQFHYSKAFENTASRYWVEKEAHAVTTGYRAFHVYAPTKTGRCHLGISFKASIPDEPLKKAAQTLSAVK
jgi:hypothetical protein